MATERKRILVVDDDEGIRKSMARLLGIEGHEVRVAKDGFEALRLCETYHPDLLVIDIRMPGIDGVETFRRLRQRMPDILAIFMTAYSASERTDAALDDGALQVFTKPLDLQQLFDQVRHQ